MAGGINLKISLLLRILAFNPAQSDMPDQILGPGLTIHYLDLNPRGFPCVMLLHGLGATCASWQLQTSALVEEGYRVVAPDMRGFGKSTYPGGKNDPKIMANDISDLCDMLDLHELHVVGISLGGTVALEFTLANPATVRSLVITNSFARLRPKKPSLWIFYLVRLLLVHLLGIETQANFVAGRLFPAEEQGMYKQAFRDQVCQSNPSGYRSTMRSLATFDARNEIGSIHSPTLIITGENDTVVPPQSQIELAELIPGANQVFIPDAGHAVTIDKPQQFNQALCKFLSENRGTR